jgi:hypothetical protein
MNLNPERRKQQRPVLHRGTELGPDSPESIERAQAGNPDYMVIIIPDKLCGKHGGIGKESRNNDKTRPIPYAPRF